MTNTDAQSLAASHPRPFASLSFATRTGAAEVRHTLCWQIARTILRLAFLGCAAQIVGKAIMAEPLHVWTIAAAAVVLLLCAVASRGADRATVNAESMVSAAIRDEARSRIQGLPARDIQSLPIGSLVVSMQRHPDAIAALTISHRTASLMMAIGPLLAAAALALVSWQASLVVLFLTPVMIVFFVLVGGLIRQLAGAQETAFGHLAGQFADRIRSLPTIIANHALGQEETKLRDRLDTYAEGTMGVLRIAFLNAAVIDFFSALSIAMLAIFLGLGHLRLAEIPGFSRLDLWQSLFILMIAPDYFAPFRRFAEQYHAKAEGHAAADALDRLLDPLASDVSAITRDAEDLAASLPRTGLVAICGPSGSGKTSLLRRMAGVDGEVHGSHAFAAVNWIGTDSPVPGKRLCDAIAWNAGTPFAAAVLAAANRVGLTADETLPEGTQTLIEGGANLSGGQRLRVSIARALLTGRTVVADEPTAKLDARTAAMVRSALQDMARTRLVLVATHDRALAQCACRTILLGPGGAREKAA